MELDILNLLGNYVFPIAMCVLMGWYVNKQTENYRQDLKDQQKCHTAEQDKITDALNNNTKVLERLVVLIEEKIK